MEILAVDQVLASSLESCMANQGGGCRGAFLPCHWHAWRNEDDSNEGDRRDDCLSRDLAKTLKQMSS